MSSSLSSFTGPNTRINGAVKTIHKSSSSSLPSSSSPCIDVGILWDVDGTLADSYELGFQSTLEVLKNYQTKKSKNKMEEVNNVIKEAIISEKEYHQGTRYTTPRRLAWHVTGNPDDEIGEDLAKEFDQLYIDLVSTKTAKFYPNLKEVLLKFNNNRVQYGALSNACGAYVCKVLLVNEVSELFKSKLGADDVPKAKPEPDGLLKCCEEMGNLLPERCIYIGDSPTGMY